VPPGLCRISLRERREVAGEAGLVTGVGTADETPYLKGVQNGG
jgi:hypothetical protein